MREQGSEVLIVALKNENEKEKTLATLIWQEDPENVEGFSKQENADDLVDKFKLEYGKTYIPDGELFLVNIVKEEGGYVKKTTKVSMKDILDYFQVT